MLLPVLALVLATTAVGAQQGSWADAMFKDGLSHDFGNIPLGTQVFHRFPMTNIYAVPLQISTRAGCNCVTATPSVRVVKPHETAYIDVTLDGHRIKGAKSVAIYVMVDGKNVDGSECHSQGTLQVSAFARLDVVLNPGQINFGIVSPGKRMTPQVLDIEYAGVLDWKVTELVAHKAPLDVTFKELYRQPGRAGYRVTVSIKPDAPVGPLRDELYFRTNDPAGPLVPVLVEANVQASLTVFPTALNMGTLRVGDSTTKRLAIQGAKAFRVLGVEGAGDGIEAQLPTAAAPTQIIIVKYQPTKTGVLRRQLKLKTDLDKESAVTVSVDGVVEPALDAGH
jgi:hypothetical protein